MHVEHFMTKNPVTCDFDATCQQAARLMRDNGVGCVVVLRNGRVAGIVNDRQLVVDCLAVGGGADVPVSEVMTRDPACVTLNDNLFSVVDTLRSAGVVRRVPVVNADKELLGIVSLSDLAVIAKDLVDAIMLDETHHSLNEAHVMTGGKRVIHSVRRPTKISRRRPDQQTRVTKRATPPGLPPKTGAPGRPRTRNRRGAIPRSGMEVRPGATSPKRPARRTFGERVRRAIRGS